MPHRPRLRRLAWPLATCVLAVALVGVLLARREPVVAKTDLVLKSADFDAGAPIPSRFTCEGKDLSPALSWTGAPGGTKSFALTVFDPDAPRPQGWVHWGAYDLPASVHELAAGAKAPGKSVKNDFGKHGYGGPCPPKGHGPHHYHFTLYALGVEHLTPEPSSYHGLVDAAKKHALATAELVGTYERN